MGMKWPSCPPLAGVEPACLTALRLDPLDVMRETARPGYGALVTLCGTVRDTEDGVLIRSITYEAYLKMAEKEIKRILRETESRFGVRAAARHRLGRVPVGETSVVAAAAGVHRPEAFAACQEIIHRIKTEAPIWKLSFERVP